MKELHEDWLHSLQAGLEPIGGPIAQDRRRSAAVLLPLYWQDDEWHLLFTRRTETVEHHRGQVSFPGGMAEPTDRDLALTALREAQEEIGLLPDEADVLGQMPALLTTTGFWVTPIVARIRWPTPLRLNEHEVAHLFGIPLAWLADPQNHSRQPMDLPGKPQPVEVIFFRPYAGEVVWGATARITLDFLHRLP